MQKLLTDSEKIVIEYLALTGKKDWRKCYIISRDKKVDPDKIAASTISVWKNSKIVQDYFNMIRYRENERIKKAIQDGIKQEREKREEIQPTSSNKNVTSENIDFTDRNEFIKYLNQAVNELSDDKQKTDYLKMLSDLLRFKESETAKDSDIQRFYTPLTCQNCVLYQTAKGNNDTL